MVTFYGVYSRFLSFDAASQAVDTTGDFNNSDELRNLARDSRRLHRIPAVLASDDFGLFCVQADAATITNAAGAAHARAPAPLPPSRSEPQRWA